MEGQKNYARASVKLWKELFKLWLLTESKCKYIKVIGKYKIEENRHRKSNLVYFLM